LPLRRCHKLNNFLTISGREQIPSAFLKTLGGQINWLYQDEKAKDKSADLGYYVDYKIVGSCYKNAADKKQAIRDILEIEDFSDFLKASRHADKFKTSAEKGKMFDSRSS
jgi:hypothetical protein